MFKNLSTDTLGVSGTSSEAIELALSYNFKGVDLDLGDFATQVKTHGLPKARRLLDSARLKFGSFRLPVNWHDDPTKFKDDMDALPPLLQLAKELDCTRAVTTIEPAGDMRPFHENYEYHRRKFTELATALSEYGIRLGLEFLAPLSHRQGRAFQFIQTVDQVLMLFKSITAPNVGLVIDSWHWHLGGGTIEQIRALSKDKIVAVYLSDCDPDVTSADATDKARRLPGETGVIDAAAILTALGELGYDGPVTPRLFRDNLAGQSRDKIVKAAATSLDQAWKAAGLNQQGKLATAAK